MDEGKGCGALALIVVMLVFYALYDYGTSFTRTITVAERPPLERKLVKGYGWRIGLGSIYPNITTIVRELPTGQPPAVQ